jgi:hypothetical protein
MTPAISSIFSLISALEYFRSIVEIEEKVPSWLFSISAKEPAYPDLAALSLKSLKLNTVTVGSSSPSGSDWRLLYIPC